ncbi:hypothetical protein [Pseudoalteromonas sp. HF66]|uniref:hypothetical protein n=1 Tax=Pseudoalteromonas sp. HF66 TaxID=2721559 RepID=UPI001431AF41|nr:hypothetical protein [Pseudoalteromonas sp. HF66]NIZ06418.1 hypothetical protein [Pseudoalteromonas sp. HF66]
MKNVVALFFLCFSLGACAVDILPSRFIDNLIYLTPELETGEEIIFFTDTGGGFNAISEDLVNKYKWSTSIINDSNGEYLMVEMPRYTLGRGIPIGGVNNFMQGKLFVVPKEEISSDNYYSGFLGARWHAEKIIYISYDKKEIAVLPHLKSVNINGYEEIKLGFLKDSKGNYITAFPSIDIKISNQTISMLLDTGATAYLSSDAKKGLSNDSNKVATSFLAASVFDKLKQENPDWSYIKNGDKLANEDMLEVPQIQIGTKLFGPVWFTRRKEQNFTEFLSPMMNTTVYGALGGSALKYLNIVIDYPGEKLFISQN